MSLKQSIVLVNEYTVKQGKKGGSRGGTPGSYVLRYMARDKATEDLTPVRLEDTDLYITRYMARKDATESLDSVSEIKDKMQEAQKLGGVAFGYGDISLSHERLKSVSKDIQKNFLRDKTVMKTVLSFDEAYLREHNLVSEDFEFKKRGDYRGNIDQMKMRMAIMNGMEKMSRHYDDLQYVGVIQVDTAHVHCHLAMVDRGVGHIMPDGKQRGKITEAMKRDLRRGIDMFLDEHQQVKMMSSNITHDKRNVLCYVRKYTHKTMEEHGFSQFLLACLPDDKRLWRASSNRKEMKKANAIVRDYVNEVLSQPDSGYGEALRSIARYADSRREREGLSLKEYQKLIRTGQTQLTNDCMNSVYGILKGVSEQDLKVRTPMLHAMSMPYEDMANLVETDPMLEFGFKLRSYSSRLNHHKKETVKYQELSKQFEEQKKRGETVDAAQPLYDFFKLEAEYNEMLMAKYQHFLLFLPPSDTYEDEFASLMSYHDRLTNVARMRDDKTMSRMLPANAEQYGLETYGVPGGRFKVTMPEVIADRVIMMEETYKQKEETFKDHLSLSGLTYEDNKITKKPRYDFDEVKAIDIHHLGFDFSSEIQISKVNLDRFLAMVARRYEAFENAKDYLVRSGQEVMVDELPGRDIAVMKQIADQLYVEPVLPSKREESSSKHRSKTVSLDLDLSKNMKLAVQSTVQSVAEMEQA